MIPLQTRIKAYCKQFHDRGLKPTVRQIAEAHGVSCDQARAELRAIRADRKPVSELEELFGFLRK